MAERYGSLLRRRLRFAESFRECATCAGSVLRNTPCSRSSALLCFVTCPDQRRMCRRLRALAGMLVRRLTARFRTSRCWLGGQRSVRWRFTHRHVYRVFARTEVGGATVKRGHPVLEKGIEALSGRARSCEIQAEEGIGLSEYFTVRAGGLPRPLAVAGANELPAAGERMAGEGMTLNRWNWLHGDSGAGAVPSMALVKTGRQSGISPGRQERRRSTASLVKPGTSSVQLLVCVRRCRQPFGRQDGICTRTKRVKCRSWSSNAHRARMPTISIDWR